MRPESDLPRHMFGITTRRVLAAGAMTGAALFGGVSVASASTAHTSSVNSRSPNMKPATGGTKPVVDGKVTAVGNGTFTVQDMSGKTFTVNVSNSTTYAERGVASVGVTDVKQGTYVDVAGTVTGSVVSATLVRIETVESGAVHPPGSGPMPTAAGKITAVGSGTFTLQDRSRTSVTVRVSSTTTYKERGVTSAGFNNVKVGAFAIVMGTETGSSVLATDVHLATTAPADAVGSGGPRQRGGGPGTRPGLDRVSGM